MKTAIAQNDKRIFLILVFSILFSVLLYMYFINTAVLNVVERERLSAEIDLLQANVAELESTYAVLRSNITLSTAYSLGFREVSATQFIKRRPLSSVSLNTLQ
ncbi:MAG: hypothetical protein KAR00_01030 [Candidatus Pacebacteria bacterium]|nr:hypothetical protein [Candidatus Paceibacterota bacterium]